MTQTKDLPAKQTIIREYSATAGNDVRLQHESFATYLQDDCKSTFCCRMRMRMSKTN